MEQKVRSISPSQWAGKGGGDKPEGPGGRHTHIVETYRDSAEKYDVVKRYFDDHLVVWRNVIFERAKFNQ